MAPYLPQLGTVLLLLESSVSNPVTKTKKGFTGKSASNLFFLYNNLEVSMYFLAHII